MNTSRWFARDTMDGEQYEVVGLAGAARVLCWCPRWGEYDWRWLPYLRGPGRELAEALLKEAGR